VCHGVGLFGGSGGRRGHNAGSIAAGIDFDGAWAAGLCAWSWRLFDAGPCRKPADDAVAEFRHCAAGNGAGVRLGLGRSNRVYCGWGRRARYRLGSDRGRCGTWLDGARTDVQAGTGLSSGQDSGSGGGPSWAPRTTARGLDCCSFGAAAADGGRRAAISGQSAMTRRRPIKTSFSWLIRVFPIWPKPNRERSYVVGKQRRAAPY